jgi:hypothetical protein
MFSSPVLIPPSLLCNGHLVSFLGVKRLGRVVVHPSSSGAEVDERVKATPVLPSLGLHCLFYGELYLYLLAS